MEREAQCACGALKARLRGEPTSIVACHCRACQKRTGSVLGVGAYYLEAQVEVSGVARAFARTSDAGNLFTTHFCPNCGTSLYWASAKNPGLIGVAVGALEDPSFPKPMRSVWEESKHAWLSVDAIAAHFSQGRA
jgi:hypothetical protein